MRCAIVTRNSPSVAVTMHRPLVLQPLAVIDQLKPAQSNSLDSENSCQS